MATNDPMAALTALIEAARSIPWSSRDNEEADLVAGFLGEWTVMNQVDYQVQLMAMKSWQDDARLAFAVLITALKNVGENYPALKLGPRVIEEAERLVKEKGMDYDEMMQRFIP